MQNALKILVIASFSYTIASSAFAPLLAVFVQNIGGGVLEISALWSVQTITIGILIFWLAKIEDRLDQRKILILGYFMYAVGFFSYIFIQTVAQMFITQIYLGIAAALTIPAFDAFYSKSLTHGKESSEWGTWESGTRIIGAGAAVIGGVIVSQFSFNLLFVFMTVFSLISGIILLRLLNRKEFQKLFSV
jgi:MFS family permease